MAKRKVRTLEEVIKQGSLCTVPEVAQALMISQPSVYALAKNGKLPCIKLGELAIRFDPKEVQALIDGSRGVMSEGDHQPRKPRQPRMERKGQNHRKTRPQPVYLPAPQPKATVNGEKGVG